MSNFITYAQNFEDLMLWRALRKIETGFYIDVGAADPDDDSVTRAFYDRGWRGINVEPTPEHFAALKAARPRDTTLQCLVGAQEGVGTLHHFADTGLSTMDATFAARHVVQGREEAVLSLPILSLAEICRQYASGAIHFLKIDVEGGEADVLRGADFSTFRPWIVVVEATEPGSQVPNWSGWEHFLVAANYRFAWFDGLNRFYIAAENWEALSPAFEAPPNVFDLWIQPRGKQKQTLNFAFDEIGHLRSELAAAHQRIALTNSANELAQVKLRSDLDRIHAVMISERVEVGRLREQLSRADAEADRHAAEMARLRAEAARLDEALTAESRVRCQTELQLVAVYQSRSWRAGAPLRSIGKLLRGQSVRPQFRQILRGGVWRIIHLVVRLPGGRLASRIFRSAMPETYAAIHDRYAARRGAAPVVVPVPQETSLVEEPPPVVASVPQESSLGQEARLSASQTDTLSPEEIRVLARLSARVQNT
ncbi:FkbM family methyltransferase [Paraburkholderia sp. GAS206C]|uniref:FkbM family methyltransferase n=1 Tax=unclassified Paraburkholderia TaxID=2615204 RepID=UPI003D1EE75A